MSCSADARLFTLVSSYSGGSELQALHPLLWYAVTASRFYSDPLLLFRPHSTCLLSARRIWVWARGLGRDEAPLCDTLTLKGSPHLPAALPHLGSVRAHPVSALGHKVPVVGSASRLPLCTALSSDESTPLHQVLPAPRWAVSWGGQLVLRMRILLRVSRCRVSPFKLPRLSQLKPGTFSQ